MIKIILFPWKIVFSPISSFLFISDSSSPWYRLNVWPNLPLILLHLSSTMHGISTFLLSHPLIRWYQCHPFLSRFKNEGFSKHYLSKWNKTDIKNSCKLIEDVSISAFYCTIYCRMIIRFEKKVDALSLSIWIQGEKIAYHEWFDSTMYSFMP